MQTLWEIWSRYKVPLGVAIAALAALLFWNFFAPETVQLAAPRGRIVVGSPSVYTRERLVNDRSEQEEWLRGELTKIDERNFGPVGFFTSVQALRRAAGIALGGAPVPSATPLADPSPAASAQSPTSIPALELFHERAAYRDALRAEIIENQLDDRHDLAGNTLYRLNFDVATLPSSHNRAYGVIEVVVSRDNEAIDDSADRAFFGDWLGGMLADANAAFRKRARDAWVVVEASGADAQAKPADAGKALASTPVPADVTQDLRSLYQHFKPEDISPCEAPGAAPETQLAKTIGCVVARKATAKTNKEGAFRWHFGSVFAEQLNRRYGSVLYVAYNNGGDAKIDLGPPPSTGSKDEPTRERLFDRYYKKYRDLVERSTTVYAYGVAPKETFDRVSVRSAYGDSLESQLAVAPPVGSAAAGLSAQGLRSRELTADAIERTARVIGFTGIWPKLAQPKFESPAAPSSTGSVVEPAPTHLKRTALQAEGRAHFGWIIGPRFQAETKVAGEPSFAQPAGHYVLSAIISAPAWWASAHVAVVAYWYDAPTDAYFNQAGDVIGPVELGGWRANDGLVVLDFDVALPRDPVSLGEVLFSVDEKPDSPQNPVTQPIIEKDKMESVAVTVGSKPEIVIPGRNLWRSPLVTLGAQQATRVKLLPNMNGLIAYFDTITEPPGWNGAKERNLTLTVWTSQKSSDSVKDKVTLYPPPKPARGDDTGSGSSGAVPAPARTGAPRSGP